MTLLQDVREKYPEFDDKSDEELTKALYDIYQQDTGEQVDYDAFKQEMGIKAVSPNLLATGGAGAPSQETMPFGGKAPKADPEADTLISAMQKELIENVPARSKQIVGGLMQSAGATAQEHLTGAVKQLAEPDVGLGDISQTAMDIAKYSLPALFETDVEKDTLYFQFKNWLKQKGRALFATGQKEAEENKPVGLNKTEQFFVDAAVAIEDMAPAIMVGYLAKDPKPALAILSGKVYGQTYGDSIEKGLDPYAANGRAVAHTLAEIIPETIPVTALLKRGPGVKRFLESSIGEGAQEALTSIITQVYDKKELEGMSLKDALLNIDWNNVGYEATIGLVVGTGLYAGVTTVEKASDIKTMRQLGKAMQEDVAAAELPVTQQEVVEALSPERAAEEQVTAEDQVESEEIPTRVTRGGAAGGMGPVSPADIAGPATQQVAGTDLGPFLDKLNSPKDAQETFTRIVKMFEPEMKAARRGKMSWDEIEKLASDYGFEHVVKRKTGEAWNPEQYEAAKFFMDNALQQVIADAKTAQETGSDADLAKFQDNLDKFTLAARNVLGARAEWGRTGSIMRKQAMSAATMQRVLDEMGGRDTLEAKVQVLADIDAANLSSEEISKKAVQLQKASTWDKILEAWKAGLLTGIRTQAVNVGSNALNVSLNIPETFVAGVIGKVHGGEKVYLRETASLSYGLLHGMKDSSMYAWEAFKSGQPVFDTDTKVHEITGRNRGAIGTDPDSTRAAQLAGQTIRIPFRMLTAGDEFFKSTARDMEVHAQAMRQALTENQTKAINVNQRAQEIVRKVRDLYGKPKPKVMLTAEEKLMWKIHDEVIDFSKYMTFQTEMGPLGKQFTKMLAHAPYLQFVAPFVRTPINIVKFGVARTPAAMLMPSVRAQLKAGGAQMDTAIARMVVGTGAMAAVMQLASQMMVTGGGPSDPREREVWLMKYQPYSVKVGDNWYAYGRIEPLGMIMGIAADLNEVADKLTDDDTEGWDRVLEAGGLLYGSLVKNLASKTFLKGITDAIAAYYDPDRYGAYWLGTMASSVVPTLSAHIAQVNDPYARKAYDIVDRLKTRIPGQREEVLPKRDIFGEILEAGQFWGPAIASPIYLKKEKDDPVVNELLALEIYPGKPERKIGGVELTPEQYDRYVELSGKMARDELDVLVASPNYQNALPFMQQQLLKSAFEDARETARVLLFSEYENLLPEQVETQVEKIRKERQK